MSERTILLTSVVLTPIRSPQRVKIACWFQISYNLKYTEKLEIHLIKREFTKLKIPINNFSYLPLESVWPANDVTAGSHES